MCRKLSACSLAIFVITVLFVAVSSNHPYTRAATKNGVILEMEDKELSYICSNSEELQLALYNLSAKGGTLSIDENIVLDRDIEIPTNSNLHKMICIRSVSGSNTIYTNGYKFAAQAANNQNGVVMGGVFFDGIRFEGVGDDCCFDMDALIRLKFNQCYFYNYNTVFLSNSKLIQDLTVSQSFFRGIYGFVINSAKETYAVSFNQCTVEASSGFAYLDNHTCGFRVSNCIIEGLSSQVLSLSGYAMGITFVYNYFEQNSTGEDADCWFDLRSIKELRSVNISDNLFAGFNRKNVKKPIICLPTSEFAEGIITICGNSLNDRTNKVTKLFNLTGNDILTGWLYVKNNTFNMDVDM